ncbi:putative pentatricopeptide [Rosa chinensis]|uniref:Putative pentatricopeptide n=1 Tax=Rosa chinensis TaxID=74649 RepID=A0A2P6PFW2_ROSCH|nr:putative pentatricopeptide [Rosa chinensis]
MRQLNQIHALLVKNPRPQVLNPWLGYLTKSSAPQNALFLYNQMLHHPTSHNHYTFTYALKACCLLHSPHKGQEIQAHVTKSGHISDTFIQNSLLHFYVIQSDIVSATRVFDSIPIPDVVSWTSMISGLSKCGFVEEAIVKFMSMDVKPNSTTLVTVLSSCSTLRALKFGKAFHGHCLRNFRERNLILDNAVLDFYLRCGSLASARYLFVNMPKRDVVSWTIVVGGYAQRGFCEEAVKLFQQLLQGGEAEPNEATIVNVLSACSSICALSSGQQVHAYISNRRDLMANVNVGNALINLYVKCGNLEMAISVFQSLGHKAIISWSTIICGMAMNGHGIHVLQLFSSMLVNGVSPDGAFIKEMPTEADGPVWGALLNACKIYGNEEMVERIRERLRNRAGVSTGTYALLSNAYAKHDRWDDSNKVRDEMREMGLKAPPGRSWIEIGPSI